MGVAVELLPVTGQTLPLISSGGSSIWMTCISLGIIISVTKKDEEIAQEIKEKEDRERILQKLIDEQIEKENPNIRREPAMSFEFDNLGNDSTILSEQGKAIVWCLGKASLGRLNPERIITELEDPKDGTYRQI